MANQQGHRPEEKFGLQFRRSVVFDISLKTDSGFKDQTFILKLWWEKVCGCMVMCVYRTHLRKGGHTWWKNDQVLMTYSPVM